MWNIRKTVKKGDYVYAVVPEHPKAIKYGYVLEHRVVMENKIGRLLMDNEEVHHIDENRRNNDPSNLEIKITGEHQSYHMRKRFPNGQTLIQLICDMCGKKFERPQRNSPESRGLKHAFCSRRCNGLYNGFKRV